jgi:4-hydroxybenzoate polyprenyltransferase
LPELDLRALGLLAFVLFGLCASSVYLLNDLLDLEDDRHHPTKRERPLAAGAFPIQHAVVLIPALLLVAFGTALAVLPFAFVLALGAYYVLTLAYSVWLKRMVIMDVVVLAMLYTMRIIAGALALGLALTFWILAFSVFIFLSLALVKRYSELFLARSKGIDAKARGRGYYPSDLEMLSSLGAAAGYLSVLVLALYIHDGATGMLYAQPEYIWFACPLLLFWISRTWLLAHRGQVHDDPVVFAIKDRVSQVVGALFVGVFLAAL